MALAEEVPVTAGDELLSQHLTEEERISITRLLVQAETGTYGEIIPVVVFSSQEWGHLSILVDLLVFSFLTCLILVLGLPWTWLLGSFALGFMAGELVKFYPESVRLLTSQSEREKAARVRAELEFYRNHFDRSQKHSTVIIFLSLVERQIVVLIEPELSKKIPDAELATSVKEISSALAQELRKKDWHQGFANAIERAGQLLQKHAPAPADYRHEYPAQIFVVGE